MIEFTAWPKTPRLFREIVVTEKIDGTNSAVHVERVGPVLGVEPYDLDVHGPVANHEGPQVKVDGVTYLVAAQSRKRIITPGKVTDNYGFAGWVYDNAEALVRTLGEGIHYGEWWGQGIQRGYGMDRKVFSLFNVSRWNGVKAEYSCPADLDVVPTLYRGPFDTATVKSYLDVLEATGSVAAPDFPRPEGVIVYHEAARQTFKALIENDDLPKGEQNG